MEDAVFQKKSISAIYKIKNQKDDAIKAGKPILGSQPEQPQSIRIPWIIILSSGGHRGHWQRQQYRQGLEIPLGAQILLHILLQILPKTNLQNINDVLYLLLVILFDSIPNFFQKHICNISMMYCVCILLFLILSIPNSTMVTFQGIVRKEKKAKEAKEKKAKETKKRKTAETPDEEQDEDVPESEQPWDAEDWDENADWDEDEEW